MAPAGSARRHSAFLWPTWALIPTVLASGADADEGVGRSCAGSGGTCSRDGSGYEDAAKSSASFSHTPGGQDAQTAKTVAANSNADLSPQAAVVFRARGSITAAGESADTSVPSTQRPAATASSSATSTGAPARGKSATEGRESHRVLEWARQAIAEARHLRDEYGVMMKQTYTRDDMGQLRGALEVLTRAEKDFFAAFRERADGEALSLSAEEMRVLLEVWDLLASTHDDLNSASSAIHYYEQLLNYDKCARIRRTNATLEYEYCSGQLYSRIILLQRHELRREGLAVKTFKKGCCSTTRRWLAPSMVNVSIGGRACGRSRHSLCAAYWDNGNDKLPLAAFLEENFDTFRGEFAAVMADVAYREAYTQNDHSLIAAGSWGELKLFDGKAWTKPCSGPAYRTCQLLSSRPELLGSFPTERTHNVRLPKEASYFKMLPGTRLKPHTGPVNFHLYCHLGLQVPLGPELRVGASSARIWKEGEALCFDDSFDHEAWHNGTEPRHVLMITFWHPDLGHPEVDPKAPRPPAIETHVANSLAPLPQSVPLPQPQKQATPHTEKSATAARAISEK